MGTGCLLDKITYKATERSLHQGDTLIMNEAQLKLWATLIAKAMSAGDMDQVTQIYSKVSAVATMEDAAKLEAMIAEVMSG